MQSSEACKVLHVTKPTLYKYREQGLIKATKLPNGYWEFDDESVYQFLNKDVPRKVYIYARVSTYKQKKDLENQVQLLNTWCFNNGLQINGIFKDIASGISFERRREFFSMLEEVLDRKVAKVVITYKDRLSRVGFELFHYLFSQFGCEIVVMSEVGNPKLDSEEVFEEIVSLLHCYSMKLYSKRKNKFIEEIVKE